MCLRLPCPQEGDTDFQAFATIGVALIAMGEDVGTDMVLRTFNHLLRYGEPAIRRAVPLAIALLCTSNPKLPVLDTLSKLSHDADSQVRKEVSWYHAFCCTMLCLDVCLRCVLLLCVLHVLCVLLHSCAPITPNPNPTPLAIVFRRSTMPFSLLASWVGAPTMRE